MIAVKSEKGVNTFKQLTLNIDQITIRRSGLVLGLYNSVRRPFHEWSFGLTGLAGVRGQPPPGLLFASANSSCAEVILAAPGDGAACGVGGWLE